MKRALVLFGLLALIGLMAAADEKAGPQDNTPLSLIHTLSPFMTMWKVFHWPTGLSAFFIGRLPFFSSLLFHRPPEPELLSKPLAPGDSSESQICTCGLPRK